MTRSVALPILLTVALLAPAGSALAQQPPPPVGPMNVFEDEGTFTYYRKGERLGTTEFTWSKSGRFFNAIEFRAGDQNVLGTTSITVDENGLWTSIGQQTATGPVEVTREGEAVQVISGETTKDLVLPPGALVMEDLSPALMSQAVVDYDHEKGGKQEFPLFFIPLAMIRGSLEYLDSFERAIGETSQSFRRYRYLMLPVYPVEIVVDESNRVCLAEYPRQEGVFVRDGYDALRTKEEPAPVEPAPAGD